MAGKIQVSTAGKLFFHRTQKNGRVQRAFKAQIGTPVGSCMSVLKGTHPGRTAIIQKVRDCTAQYKGTKLNLNV